MLPMADAPACCQKIATPHVQNGLTFNSNSHREDCGVHLKKCRPLPPWRLSTTAAKPLPLAGTTTCCNKSSSGCRGRGSMGAMGGWRGWRGWVEWVPWVAWVPGEGVGEQTVDRQNMSAFFLHLLLQSEDFRTCGTWSRPGA